MDYRTPIVAACIAAACPALAQLDPVDIVIKAEDGVLITGSVDPNGDAVWGTRVFVGTFGEFPNYTNDPGIDSPNNAFPPGADVGFDILAALRLWDGSQFKEIPPERIEVRKGGLFVSTPESDEVVPGFSIGEANGVGKFHHHPGYTLLDPAGNGIYLFEWRLWTDAQGIGPSQEVFIVFNQNMSEDEHHEAEEWVRDHLPGECEADIDGNGALDLFDFLGFTNLFNAQDPRADFTGDGAFDLFDFLAFVNLFNAGCP